MPLRYIIPVLILLISSCYDYPHISIDIENNPVVNDDSSRVCFFAFSTVYRPARGITAFPDGGQPDIIYKNVSLFQYTTTDREFKKLHKLGEIPYNKSRWACDIYFSGDSVLFKINPVSGWDFELGLNARIDSALYNKYHCWYLLSPGKDRFIQISGPDSTLLRSASYPVSIIKNEFEKLDYSKKGIRIDSLLNLSLREMKDHIDNNRGNAAYREALKEFLASDKVNK